MYTLPLKKTEKLRNPRIDPKQFDYSQLLKTIIDTPPQGGFTLSDLRLRNKMVDSIEECEKIGATELVLSDNEFKLIESVLPTFQWGVLEPVLVQFHDDVMASKHFEYPKEGKADKK